MQTTNMQTTNMQTTNMIMMTMFIMSDAIILSAPINKTFRYVGSTPPFENFDPLNIRKNNSENRVKFTREAELQYSCDVMLSTVVISFIELMDKDDSVLGINYLTSMDFYNQAPIWFGITSYEVVHMAKCWVNPFNTQTTFMLKENYQPGNLFNVNIYYAGNDLLNKELNNGRLAMTCFIGIFGQELVIQHGVF